MASKTLSRFSPLSFTPTPFKLLPHFRCLSVAAAAGDPTTTTTAADTVEHIFTNQSRIEKLTKMDRRLHPDPTTSHWFPYLDTFTTNDTHIDSKQVIDVLDPYIMEQRKLRLRQAVLSRSYSVCLVVEGLSDLGNVSAAFRSADALGIQSVHVISTEVRKRYRDNRHVSKGAEKWLDIEMWKSARECFEALKGRGYRIATTHLGAESVSIHDLDWSSPTAIVVGNEHLGISEEALQLSDVHCSIPMNGMVDSFNVSVAAGILMHHAVYDRVSRLGYHGDLTPGQRQILLAEFFLRHRESTLGIVHEYAKRKVDKVVTL